MEEKRFGGFKETDSDEVVARRLFQHPEYLEWDAASFWYSGWPEEKTVGKRVMASKSSHVQWNSETDPLP